MYVKHIDILNLGTFAEPDRTLSLDLIQGAIGIFGRNGSGKSTMLGLMHACITGDFGRFAGVKADCISNIAAPRAKAYVGVDAIHNGVDFRIERHLRPGKQRLIVPGRKDVDKDADIAAFFAEIGLEKRLLDFAVFQPQNRIFDVLSMTPAKRQEAFQILNGTVACQGLVKLLNAKRQAYMPAVEDGRADELAVSLAGKRARIAELESQAAGLEAGFLPEERRVPLAAAEARYAERAAWETSLDSARRQHSLAGDKLRDARDRHAKAAALLAVFGDADYEQEDRAASTAHAAETARAIAVDAAKLAEANVAKYEAELAALAVPPLVGTDADVDALTLEYDTARTLLAAAKARLDSLAKAGTAACPTCGTPVGALAGVLESDRKTVANYPAGIERMRVELAAMADSRKAEAAALRQRDEYNRWIKRERQTIDGFASRGIDVHSPLRTTALLNAANAARQAAMDWRTARNEHKLAGELAAAAESAAADLDGAVNRLLSSEPAPIAGEEVAEARRLLDADDDARRAAAAVRGEIKSETLTASDVEAELAKVRRRDAAAAAEGKLARILEHASATLDWNGLPGYVSASNLAAMSADIQRALDRLGSPFRVETLPDLTMLVHIPGHPPMPAERLSCGRQSILALAFWDAVTDVFGEKTGMLALDEPTANLDDENVALLAGSLRALSTAVHGRRQLLIVTHADRLANSFDQVVHIG